MSFLLKVGFALIALVLASLLIAFTQKIRRGEIDAKEIAWDSYLWGPQVVVYICCAPYIWGGPPAITQRSA